MTEHISEDDLTLYYYGEGRRRDAIERHVDECPSCAALYREISGTLAMIAAPEVPERGDQYGLEVWQRIRHLLPERQTGFSRFWAFSGFGLAAAAALLLVAAFAGGRAWQRAATPAATSAANGANSPSSENLANREHREHPENPEHPEHPENPENRILLTSVADHLDRSARMLSDIMNASDHDISTEQRWAGDLLDTSRLYRQDAVDAGEQSVAGVLDELERSLLDIVHSPSRISAADLEQLRRRIDAAALLFKVRVMSDDLRQREQPQPRATPRSPTLTVS